VTQFYYQENFLKHSSLCDGNCDALALEEIADGLQYLRLFQKLRNCWFFTSFEWHQRSFLLSEISGFALMLQVLSYVAVYPGNKNSAIIVYNALNTMLHSSQQTEVI
jgi:hypothetical protein